MISLIPFKELKASEGTPPIETSSSLQTLTALNQIRNLHIPLFGVVVLLVNCFIFTTTFTVFETVSAL
jgi:hypothetical protein